MGNGSQSDATAVAHQGTAASGVEQAAAGGVSVVGRVPVGPAHQGFGVRRLLRILGPGLVTGAADDPSGIEFDQRVMGAQRSAWLSRVTVWVPFAGMAGSALLAIVALAHK